MALKTLYGFFGAMMSIALFLLTQEEYVFDFKAQDTSIAQITLHDVKNYEIALAGINTITTAKEVRRFASYDELLNVETLMKEEDQVALLRANKATLRGPNVLLEGEVYYTRSDDVTFESDEANYNRETNIAEGSLPFLATYGPHQSKGESFEYNTQTRELVATKIDATLETENQ